MKRKLFTDFDLDGVGCGILATLLWGNDVDIIYCNNHNPNPYLEEFFSSKEYNNYDEIYITDVSPNEENAQKIQELLYENNKIVSLYDHHETALWLNDKYEWCLVKINYFSDKEQKTSGTDMFYKLECNNIQIYNGLENFVETIRQYDTWEWVTKYNNIIPRKLNDLFMFLGRDNFIDISIKNIKNNKDVLDESMNFILNIQEQKCNEYIELQNKNIKIFKQEIDNIKYNFGVVFSERREFTSILGNKLAKLHPELDFIMIINSFGIIDLRGIKNDINLSTIAKYFNGGGHQKAAGFNFDINILDNIIYSILLE